MEVQQLQFIDRSWSPRRDAKPVHKSTNDPEDHGAQVEQVPQEQIVLLHKLSSLTEQ